MYPCHVIKYDVRPERIALTIRFIWCPYFSYLINIGSSNADIMFLSFSKKNVKNNVK
jgi:hypothetical protein